jgi:hypothetical protein
MNGSPSPSAGRPSIVHEIGDAFRVAYSPPESIGDSTWRTLLGTSRSPPPAPQSTLRTREEEDVPDTMWQSDFDDIVVIPSLGNSQEESEIHALLQMHGMTTMQSRPNLRPEENEEEDDEMDGSVRRRPMSWMRDSAMEVDELESDCTTSHANSRSSSPRMWQARSRRTSGAQGSREEHEADEKEGDCGASRQEKELQYLNDLDIAGVCFDPRGQSVYVASTRSIVEWKVRGAEMKFWPSEGWR